MGRGYGRSAATWIGVAVAVVVGLAAVSCRPPDAAVDAPAGEGSVSTPASVSAFAWNLNRGVGPDPDASLPEIVSLLADAGEHDLWAFSEMDPEWYAEVDAALERAAGEPVEGRLGQSGRQQRLALFWRASRFEPLEISEMGRVNVDGYGRAPVAALLRDRVDGRQTLWVAVHFRRANADARAEEARILGDLLAQLSHRTVVLGDANMDCPVDGGACDRAFGELVANGFLAWVPPQPAMPTSCRSGGDMLDLAFVGGIEDVVQPTVDVEASATWCTEGMGSGAHVPFSIVLRAQN